MKGRKLERERVERIKEKLKETSEWKKSMYDWHTRKKDDEE